MILLIQSTEKGKLAEFDLMKSASIATVTVLISFFFLQFLRTLRLGQYELTNSK